MKPWFTWFRLDGDLLGPHRLSRALGRAALDFGLTMTLSSARTVR